MIFHLQLKLVKVKVKLKVTAGNRYGKQRSTMCLLLYGYFVKSKVYYPTFFAQNFVRFNPREVRSNIGKLAKLEREIQPIWDELYAPMS